MNKRGDVFETLITVTEKEAEINSLNYNITHAFVVAKNSDGFLLMLNHWRQHWELVGGIKEDGETLRERALREMEEESNQIPMEIKFLGLMKFNLHNGKTEYGGLFTAWIQETRPFIKNTEADKIQFWNGQDDIGRIDEIDQYLLRYYKD
ncbi:NUDIX hydrolase [Paenibacillus sp. T3-5-0-4]|nr:NUDIX hydrolase [Paenibacillus endoradicis]